MILKLEVFATVITVVAVYLISEQHYLWGWIISFFADLLWALWGYWKNAYYLVGLQFLLAIIAVNGIINALQV